MADMYPAKTTPAIEKPSTPATDTNVDPIKQWALDRHERDTAEDPVERYTREEAEDAPRRAQQQKERAQQEKDRAFHRARGEYIRQNRGWMDDPDQRQHVRDRDAEAVRRDLAEAARRDLAAGATPEQRQSTEPADAKTTGLNYEDPWDKPNAIQQAPGEESFARYRVPKPIALEAPVNFQMDEQAVADLGHVAVREGWSPEFAQGLVDTFVTAAPKDEKLDDVLVREVNKFCSDRPALAAWLDETGVGNSPTAIKLLAAAAREPALLTKPGAEKFIAGLKENRAYAKGDKLEVAKARLAFMVAG
jgi:hypothetical protein